MNLTNFSFNMILEDARKATFKYWPFEDSSRCNKAKMAEAGFYSSGKRTEADLAVCYICCKELDGWEEGDDPWSEHMKHAPYCPFIKLGKKPSMLTVNDLLRLQEEHDILLLKRDFEDMKKQLMEKEVIEAEKLQRREPKENSKPRAPIRRKRSSRK